MKPIEAPEPPIRTQWAELTPGQWYEATAGDDYPEGHQDRFIQAARQWARRHGYRFTRSSTADTVRFCLEPIQ